MLQIWTEMHADEMHALCNKHHKVSSFLKSHQNTHNSVKYEAIWKWHFVMLIHKEHWISLAHISGHKSVFMLSFFVKVIPKFYNCKAKDKAFWLLLDAVIHFVKLNLSSFFFHPFTFILKISTFHSIESPLKELRHGLDILKSLV